MRIPEIDLNEIEDAKMRELVVGLLNIIEDLSANMTRLQEENQRLRDEVNRLKGEQGKPDIKPNKKRRDHSSEKERRVSGKHQKKSKQATVKIDHEEVLKVDRSQLPPDAQFKGYEEVVVQDIQLRTNNIRFYKEKFYSKSERKTYLAPLPLGYQGQFGPQLRTQILVLYYAGQMTAAKIHSWLQQIGIEISLGQVSNFLIKGLCLPPLSRPQNSQTEVVFPRISSYFLLSY